MPGISPEARAASSACTTALWLLRALASALRCASTPRASRSAACSASASCPAAAAAFLHSSASCLQMRRHVGGCTGLSHRIDAQTAADATPLPAVGKLTPKAVAMASAGE